MQRGCLTRPLLIDYDTLPAEIQIKLGDPRKCDHIMERWFAVDKDAQRFFTNFKFENRKGLAPKFINEYVANASVLKAVDAFKTAHVEELAKKQKKAFGVLVGTLGNISASVGKAKLKKSFNVAAIAAAIEAQKDAVLNYSIALPAGKDKVVFVDTEQGKYHCYQAVKKILTLANLPLTHQPEELEFLSLRKYSEEERVALITYISEHTPNLGLIIIDGIRDLVHDINDSAGATHLITSLMALSDKHNIHIHCVLHQNKDNQSVRGAYRN